MESISDVDESQAHGSEIQLGDSVTQVTVSLDHLAELVNKAVQLQKIRIDIERLLFPCLI